MKTKTNAALTLMLTASMVATSLTSLPAAAQFPLMPPPAPRYPAPPQQYPPQPASVSANWTRVRAIAPRSPIRVTAVGLGDQDHQFFVSASERELTLLTLGGVPRSAKRLLLTLAGSHPELFMQPDRWMEFRDGNVRVNADGLFVGRRKLADLADVAKTIDAGDVAEVSAETTVQRPLGHDVDPEAAGIAGLTFVGALYGTVALCKDKCGSAALLPIFGAPIIAGMLAARRSGHAMQLIYRVR